MPTYEFRCPNGHAFEKFYRTMSSSEMEVPCPECAEPAARQISGGAGLVFKGSGFYLTDYGKNAHRGEAAKPGTESGGTKSGAGESGGSGGGTAASGGGSSDAPAKSESKADKSTPAPPPKPSSPKGE